MDAGHTPPPSPPLTFALCLALSRLFPFLFLFLFMFLFLFLLLLVVPVSGAVPEEPVISPKSGAVFERKLIEKHLRENNTDPISGDELQADELIAVKGVYLCVFVCVFVYLLCLCLPVRASLHDPQTDTPSPFNCTRCIIRC